MIERNPGEWGEGDRQDGRGSGTTTATFPASGLAEPKQGGEKLSGL